MESSAPASVTSLLILASIFTLFPRSPPGKNTFCSRSWALSWDNRFNKIYRKYLLRTATCTWWPANLFMIPGRHISRDSIIFFSLVLLWVGIQWHHHHGLVAILSKEILTYYMMASKVIPGNQDKLMESLASESFTTLLVDLGWSMVQFKLS